MTTMPEGKALNKGQQGLAGGIFSKSRMTEGGGVGLVLLAPCTKFVLDPWSFSILAFVHQWGGGSSRGLGGPGNGSSQRF